MGLLVLVLIVVGWFLWNKKQKENEIQRFMPESKQQELQNMESNKEVDVRQKYDEEREALQGEAMLRVVDGGSSLEEAAIVAKGIGELYDIKIAEKRVNEGMLPLETERGLFGVRAALYLLNLKDGKSSNEVNKYVKNLGVEMPPFVLLEAIEFIDGQYAGKQLPMISDAKRKGFKG